jgi:hypothetical protein
VDIDPSNSGSNKSLVGTLKTDPWAIPLLFRVGVAMDVYQDESVRVTLAADALRPSDNEESLNFGGEIGMNDIVFLRAGYKAIAGPDEFSTRNTRDEGLSLGAGLKYVAEGLGSVEVNYAFTKFGLFGNLNTIALTIGF